MFVALACVVALVCAAASLQRLSFALAPTALDPKMLSDVIATGRPSLDEFERAVSRAPGARWERDLAQAMKKPAQSRIGDVNEQLLELDRLASRWSRVPRVCASVATSFGLLLGSLALREGLLDPEPEHIDQLIVRALNVVAIGVAGAIVCAAVHFRVGKAAKSRLLVVDGMVERLEKLSPSAET
jgi:hypothetical protein